MLKKRLLILGLSLIFCLSLAPAAMAARDYTDAENKAQALKYLGLMQGVSDTDFDLNRAPTRLETLVMFLRLLGEEGAALAGQEKHPFTDVPAWGSPYVAYAYQKNYTNGESSTAFGSNRIAGANVFLTFTLRALGYSDRAGGDFTWDKPHGLARNLGLLYDGVDTENFLRADVALLAWEALFVEVKGTDTRLKDVLMLAELFTERDFEYAWDIAYGNDYDIVFGVRIGTYICYEDGGGFEYDPSYRPSLTLNVDQSFSVVRNLGEGMEPGSGYWIVETDEFGFEYVVLNVTSKHWEDEIREYYLWIDARGNLMLENRMGLTFPSAFFIYED